MLVKKTLTFHLLPNLPPIASLTPSLVKWNGIFKRRKETSGLQFPLQSRNQAYKGYMFQRATQDEGESSTAYPTWPWR